MIYEVVCGVISLGFYGIFAFQNLVKRVISAGIMQTGVILLYVCTGFKGSNSVPPVIHSDHIATYANPLPQVLMLTAIVVGVATTSVCLAIIIKIYKAFNTLESREIDNMCQLDNSENT